LRRAMMRTTFVLVAANGSVLRLWPSRTCSFGRDSRQPSRKLSWSAQPRGQSFGTTSLLPRSARRGQAGSPLQKTRPCLRTIIRSLCCSLGVECFTAHQFGLLSNSDSFPEVSCRSN
jgi:hypothetical protein